MVQCNFGILIILRSTINTIYWTHFGTCPFIQLTEQVNKMKCHAKKETHTFFFFNVIKLKLLIEILYFYLRMMNF